MFHYIVVDSISGEIKYPAYGTSESCFHRSDCTVIKIDKPLGNYNDYFFNLRTGNVEKRIECPVVVNKTTIKADGSDAAIFSNIPNGTVCAHDGETYTITDGILEFTTTHDGEYDFTFELFPYITASFTITAEEPES